MEPLSAETSPDIPRALLEYALDTLSFSFRTITTLPADGADSSKPLPAAYAEDCAIVSPLKHCAFSGCTWSGDDSRSQAFHTVEHHYDLLEEGMEAYNIYIKQCCILD